MEFVGALVVLQRLSTLRLEAVDAEVFAVIAASLSRVVEGFLLEELYIGRSENFEPLVYGLHSREFLADAGDGHTVGGADEREQSGIVVSELIHKAYLHVFIVRIW